VLNGYTDVPSWILLGRLLKPGERGVEGEKEEKKPARSSPEPKKKLGGACRCVGSTRDADAWAREGRPSEKEKN